VSVIERVLNLQEYDCRIRDMEKELKDIPARKEREQSRLEAHKKELAQAEQQLKAAQAEVKKIEIEVESHREKTRKLRQQQFEIKTNKEFKAIETEIATVQGEIAKTEEVELLLMLDVEAARAEVETKRKALAQEDATVNNDVEAWAERASRIQQELEGIRGKRQAAAVGIDPEWLANYERIFRRRDRALVPLEEGGVCGGCHMQMPPYVIHDARKRTSIVTCGFCGRMVY